MATNHEVKSLTATTWPAFAALMDRHHGVWGGCWCMGYHPESFQGSREGNRAAKEWRVRAGAAHAALVFDGPNCLGWCQYGRHDELRLFRYQKDCANEFAALPEWLITCFFVGRRFRGHDGAAAALAGALGATTRDRGGRVEAYPEAFNGREVSTSLPFMAGGPIARFERHGFSACARWGSTVGGREGGSPRRLTATRPYDQELDNSCGRGATPGRVLSHAVR